MGAGQSQNGGFHLCGACDDDSPVRFNYIGTPERMFAVDSSDDQTRSRDQEMTDVSNNNHIRPRQTSSDSMRIIQGIFQMGERIIFVEYDPKDVENASSLHDGQCIICMHNEVDLTLLPCRHSICHECWNKIHKNQGPKCPHCRGYINTIRTKSPSLTPMVTNIIFSHKKQDPQADHPSGFFPSHSRPVEKYSGPSRTISRRTARSHQEETERILEDLDDSTSDSDGHGAQEPPQEHVPQQKRTSDINLRRLSKWFVKNKDAQGRGA